MKNSNYKRLVPTMRSSSVRFLLIVTQLMITISLAHAQCDPNPDFIVAPDGTNTPTIVRVIDEFVDGQGGAGIGTIEIGIDDGTITQTQTLRMASNGYVVADNSTCADPINTAGVFIQQTGILDMQGGGIDAINLAVIGPSEDDAALGGILKGYGKILTTGSDNIEAVRFDAATINPTGILSLSASRSVGGSTIDETVNFLNSTYEVILGGSTTSYVNILKGSVQLSNTKLAVSFPSGFTPAANQQFTLMKFSGGSRSGTFANSSGTLLGEGATLTVGGVAMKISYVGGASHKDIMLTAPGALPKITVSNANSNFEGTAAAPGTTTFDISLSAASDSAVTVNYATADGTAKVGSDYVEKHGKITFAPGETLRSVTIKYVGDNIAELVETLFFNLNTPVNATIADGQGTTSIRNDDGPGVFIENPPNVVEGNGGTVAQKFIVRLSVASPNTITMNWATSNGTATTADYTAATGTVTFAPGQMSKGITILVKGDTAVEPNETYKVTLSALKYAVFTDSQAVGIIVNDD